MSNVLPQAAQKKIWRMYRARFLVVLSFTLLILAALASTALAPSYLALKISSAPSAAVEKTKRSEENDPTAIIRAQTLMSEMNAAITASSSPSNAVRAALALKPEKVKVDHISFDRKEFSELVISGTAPREAVNEYRTALDADERFASISIPVAALVGSEGGRFSITLTGDF